VGREVIKAEFFVLFISLLADSLSARKMLSISHGLCSSRSAADISGGSQSLQDSAAAFCAWGTELRYGKPICRSDFAVSGSPTGTLDPGQEEVAPPHVL